MSKNLFVACGYTSFLKNNATEGYFIRDRPELQNKVLTIFEMTSLGRAGEREMDFVLISGTMDDGSTLWVSELLLLYR